MKCQITYKKLLKLINMYEINESGCQVLHVVIQKIYFFFSWILLPPKFKQNSLVQSLVQTGSIQTKFTGFAAWFPGKVYFPQKEIVMSQI